MPLKNRMPDLVRDLEAGVNAARKQGDVGALLDIASAAMDRLEAAAAAARGEYQAMALNAARRIGYNAAADVWPGWEVGTAARSDTELQAAQTLARRSSVLVERLGKEAEARAKASWLIGAFDLARGRHEEALEAFAKASEFIADPAMKLLSQGYMAITAELLGTSSKGEMPEFASVIAGLDELASEDAKGLRNQLEVARQVFRRV